MNKERFLVYMLTDIKNKIIHVDLINSSTINFILNSSSLMDDYIKNYKVNKLVYYESGPDLVAAIKREKEIKSWSRDKKKNLVETNNPKWINLMNKLKTKHV